MPEKPNEQEDLWHFACTLYQKADIQVACHTLQTYYNVDVPLLLFCFWLTTKYRWQQNVLDQCLREALYFTQTYTEKTVYPLRAIRCEMKNNYHSEWRISMSDWHQLREQVKALELECERQQLRGLAAVCMEYCMEPLDMANTEYQHAMTR